MRPSRRHRKVNALVTVDGVRQIVVPCAMCGLVPLNLSAVAFLKDCQLDGCRLSGVVRIDVPCGEPLDGLVLQFAGQTLVRLRQICQLFPCCGGHVLFRSLVRLRCAACQQRHCQNCRQQTAQCHSCISFHASSSISFFVPLGHSMFIIAYSAPYAQCTNYTRFHLLFRRHPQNATDYCG